MGEKRGQLTREERERIKRECAQQFSEAMVKLVTILERESRKPKRGPKRELPPEKQRELEECARRFSEAIVRVFEILERQGQRREGGER